MAAREGDDMRVLVLFPGALGDLCLLAPAVAALADRGACVELSEVQAAARTRKRRIMGWVRVAEWVEKVGRSGREKRARARDGLR